MTLTYFFRLCYVVAWSIIDGIAITSVGTFVECFNMSHEKTSHRLFQHWASKLASVTHASLGNKLHVDCPDLINTPTLITSNHQSWVDIFVLLTIFQHRLPVMIFIMKKQLLYLPLFGTSSYLIGCPMLSRSGHRKDLKLIQKSVSRFQHACYVLFPEGTRLKQPEPPYTYLQKPKPLGVSAILKSQHNTKWLDCHIYYETTPSFYDFLMGRMGNVHVHAEWVTDMKKGAVSEQWQRKDNWLLQKNQANEVTQD